MRLTAKLLSVFLGGVIVITAVNAYWSFQREAQWFAQETHSQARRLGSAMEQTVLVVWRQQGRSRALKMIEACGDQHGMRIRWVWFHAKTGEPYAPHIPAEQIEWAAVEQKRSFQRYDSRRIYLHTYWPIDVPDPNDGQGGLEFSKPLSLLDTQQGDVIVRTLILLGTLVLLTGIVVGVAGVRFVGRPLTELVEHTRRVAAGDLTARVQLSTKDELGELAASFNEMCDKLAQSQHEVQQQMASRVAAMEQLRHADRLKTVGRLASGVAHELGTPLNVVLGRAGLIASGKISGDAITQSATTIRGEVEKMSKTIRQLLDFSRPSTPKRITQDVRPMVRETVELLSPLARKQHVELSVVEDSEPLMASIDVSQLQQVLTNLVVNAVQAMPQRGTVEVSVSSQHLHFPEEDGEPRDYVCLSVRDEGQGIQPEDLPHLFEPYFTTKDIGEGTGLGLSIAYGIVQDHGGWIDVASEPGRGSCFRVYLLQEGSK